MAVPLHLADFLSDEQVLELFEAIHRVTWPTAHHSPVGMYLDNCSQKARPYLVIPRGMKRGVQGNRKAPNANIRDANTCFPIQIGL